MKGSLTVIAVTLPYFLAACSDRHPVKGVRFASASLVVNAGQWEETVLGAVRAPGVTVGIGDAGRVSYTSTRGQVSLTFEGGATSAAARWEQRRPGAHHFLRGDRCDWVTNVGEFGAVWFDEIYHGVDVGISAGDEHLKYDLMIEPDADVDAIVVRCAGFDDLVLEGDDLVLTSEIVAIRQPKPVCWLNMRCTLEIQYLTFFLISNTLFTLDFNAT